MTTLTDAERVTFGALTESLAIDPTMPPAPPILATAQAQGDILAVPTNVTMPHTTQPVLDGTTIPLVVSGNGHQVRVVGPGVAYAVVRTGHVLAVLDIRPGSHAFLEQPGEATDRHDPIGLAPGRWEIRRQMRLSGRQAAEWVSD